MRSLPGQDSRAPGKTGPDPRYLGVRSSRDRILSAVAELASEHGYQELTLDQIARTARVSHTTFQSLFAGKEEAFLAALADGVKRATAALDEALGSESQPWPERIRAGLTALLEAAAAEPELARSFLIESRTAGPHALALYDDALARLVPSLHQGRALGDGAAELPDRMEEGIIGGVAWHLSERLAEGQAERLPELAPDLLTIVLSPYLGERQARELARGAGRLSAGAD